MKTIAALAALIFVPFAAHGEETAILAGGCFWCLEAEFSDLPGINKVTSGYTGGNLANPSYADVSSGETGHVEAIEVRFEPSQISYEQVLNIFWRNIDPFDADGQFCDKGSQYHSVIFYLNPAQRAAAEKSKQEAKTSLQSTKPIATLIKQASAFYPAEAYHQGYAKKNPRQYGTYKALCRREKRLNEVWQRR